VHLTGARQGEVSEGTEVTEPESREIVPNSFEDFDKRLADLLTEAYEYGLISVAVLYDSDIIGHNSKMNYYYRGGMPTAVGLAELARQRISAEWFAPDVA
jgi:hypothetical protein